MTSSYLWKYDVRSEIKGLSFHRHWESFPCLRLQSLFVIRPAQPTPALRVAISCCKAALCACCGLRMVSVMLVRSLTGRQSTRQPPCLGPAWVRTESRHCELSPKKGNKNFCFSQVMVFLAGSAVQILAAVDVTPACWKQP